THGMCLRKRRMHLSLARSSYFNIAVTPSRPRVPARRRKKHPCVLVAEERASK
ncbi:hypothetical protein ACLOJK_036640, partial [Asimina triloba]